VLSINSRASLMSIICKYLDCLVVFTVLINLF